jgi:hypothetical protein
VDEYYYYAACIFLISVFSITTTLIETRSVSQKLETYLGASVDYFIDYEAVEGNI